MDNWIKNYEKEEEKYEDFYKSPVKKITLTVIFLNLNNEIIKVKKEQKNINDGILNRDSILSYFIRNKTENNKRYKLISLMTYLVDLNKDNIKDYILEEDINLFFKNYSDIQNIIIPDTIKYFHDTNEIYFILKEKTNVQLNTTKKIKLSNKKPDKNKHKFTKSKY